MLKLGAKHKFNINARNAETKQKCKNRIDPKINWKCKNKIEIKLN